MLTVTKAASLINEGNVVAFPTETVYGLGADAWNPDAVQKVFDIKGRPADNPLIVHISSKAMVEDFAGEVSEDARKLMDRFWPGPLTLIFRKKPEVLDSITGGLDTVALRWPGHPLSQELITLAGPLVAPSANKSGRPSPTKPEHVNEDFGPDFPVIAAGETQIGLESTVLDTTTEPFRIYRPGYIGLNEIEKCLGRPVETGKEGITERRSPGTRYSHYAPDAKVRWLESSSDAESLTGNALYLVHSYKKFPENDHIIHYNGDYDQFARELYDRFRQADHEGLDTVFIEPFTETLLENVPLARALVNRIEKAVGD